MRLTFLGQSGFIIDDGPTRIVIDPFLGDLEDPVERLRFPRLFPPPLSVESLGQPSLALVSHHHGDHFHIQTLTALALQAPSLLFVTTPTVGKGLVKAGIAKERIVVPDFPGWIEVANVRVGVVPAAHYQFSERSDVAFDYFGFVVETMAGNVYSAGDTIPFNGLSRMLRVFEARIGLLPINGRDADRESIGIIGNMNVREAVSVARECGLEWLIPCHFDMFAANAADPREVVFLVAPDDSSLQVRILRAGETQEFGPRVATWNTGS